MWRKIIDEFFTRYIFVIDLIIIIILAAFIAAAIDQNISGRIDGAISKYKELSASTSTKSTLIYGKGKKLTTKSTFKAVDGKAILSRNFFDSETGPLDEQELGLQDFTEPRPSEVSTGIRARMVVAEVIKAGRMRRWAPCRTMSRMSCRVLSSLSLRRALDSSR